MRSGKSPDDLLLLAIMVIGNFERALVGFKDQRLVTEGVIHLNALICIVILLTADHLLVSGTAVNRREPVPARWGRLVAMGAGAALIAVLVDWAIVRGLYGDRFPATPGSVSALDRTPEPGGPARAARKRDTN